VTVRDAFSNTATGYVGTVHFSSSDTNAILPANYTFTSGDAGVKSFSAALRTSGTRSISAADTVTGSITGIQSGILVVPAAATNLVLSGYPNPATAGTANSFTVTAKDTFNNNATSYVGSVTFISSDPSAILPADYAFVSSDAGTHTFNATFKTAGTQALTATDVATNTLTGSQSGIVINPAAASRLTISTQPSPTATAGVLFAQQPVIRIEDAFGNLRTGDSTTSVTATRIAGNGTLQGTTSRTASGGIVTFTNLSHNVATNITIQFAASGLTSATSTVVSVSAAVADRLAFTTQPGNATAGAVFGIQPVVQSQDPFGNFSTVGLSNSMNVTLTLTAGTGPLQGTVTLDIGTNTGNGTVSFSNLEIDIAGTNKQLTASAAGLTSGLSAVFTVNPAAANQLTILTQPSLIATAGVAFAQQPVIRIEDQFGNLRTSDSSTVVIATRGDGSGTLQGTTSRTASGGVVTFTNLSHNVSTNITIVFSSGSLLTATSTVVSVNPAPANRLAIQTQPSSTATAGVPFVQQPVVLVQDAFGNLRTNDNSTVVIATRSAGSGTLQGTTNITAVGGVVTYGNLSHNAATNITIAFNSSGLLGTTSSVVAVSAAVANRLTVLTQPSLTATAGVVFAQQPVVRIEDQFGNLITSDSNTVVTASRGGGSGTLQGTTGRTAAGGIVTYTNLSHPVATAITIVFSGSGLLSTTSSTVTVNAGAVAKLQVVLPGEAVAPGTVAGKTGTPNDQTAGTAIISNIVVNAVDANWNIVPTATTNVTISSTDTNAAVADDNGATTGNLTLVAGTRTLSSFTFKTAGTRTITASATGFSTNTSTNVTVNVGTVAKLEILVPGETTAPGTSTGKTGSPSSQSLGVAIANGIVVNAVDANWNTVTGATPNVAITSSDTSATIADDNGAAAGNLTLGAGAGTLSSFTFNNGGAQTITATDAAGILASSTSAPITLGKTASTTTLASDLNPSGFGQSVTFTATVNGSVGTPTGTVTFKDGTTSLATNSLSSAVATFTTSALTGGSHSITAVYNGDTDYNSSTSSIVTQVVNKASSSAVLVSSGTPSVFGQPVIFTATISPVAPATATPTGTVTFKDGAIPLKTNNLSSGQTTYTNSALAVGSHTITVVYNGDTNYNTSTSANLSQTVNKADTTTTVTSSANPSVFGQSVTFTAAVNPVAPGAGTRSGNVQFKTNGVNFGAAVALTSGSATSSALSTLAVGSTLAVTADYLGDTNFNASSGSLSGGQTVNKANSTSTVSSSSNPAYFDTPFTLSATVSAVSPGVGTPTGTVQFTIDGTNLDGPATLSGGSATKTNLSSISIGSHVVNAIYSGDGNFNTNISANFAQTVAASQVTPATGGTAISADATGGAYTNLTGPVYLEPATASVGLGFIILNAPPGFVFATNAPVPTVRVNGDTGNAVHNINNIADGGTIAVTVTTNSLTINITSQS